MKKGMIVRQSEDKRIYQLQASIVKALAHPLRLEILHLLGDREVASGELLSRLGVAKAKLSQHLAVLRQRGIVTDRREGVHVFYRLTHPEIEKACQAVQEVLARHLKETGREARVLLGRVR